MKLGQLIALQAGGPGSGCHGDNCGRPAGSGLDIKGMVRTIRGKTENVAKVREAVEQVTTKHKELMTMLLKKPLKGIDIMGSVTKRQAELTGVDGRQYLAVYNSYNRRITIDPDRVANVLSGFTPGKTWLVRDSWSAQNGAYTLNDTLIHELGHHIDNKYVGRVGNIGPTKMQSLVSGAFEAATNKRVAISGYALRDRSEYFAETFSAFLQRPDDLRAIDPMGYRVMDKLIAKATKGAIKMGTVTV